MLLIYYLNEVVGIFSHVPRLRGELSEIFTIGDLAANTEGGIIFEVAIWVPRNKTILDLRKERLWQATKRLKES
jgi:hypothetical protein